MRERRVTEADAVVFECLFIFCVFERSVDVSSDGNTILVFFFFILDFFAAAGADACFEATFDVVFVVFLVLIALLAPGGGFAEEFLFDAVFFGLFALFAADAVAVTEAACASLPDAVSALFGGAFR